MELDTVMPNALTILSSSMEKPTPVTGRMTKATTAAAVLSSMCGRPTNRLMLILLIPAKLQATIAANSLNVETAHRGKTESVTKTAATSILSETETKISMGLGLTSRLTPLALSQL